MVIDKLTEALGPIAGLLATAGLLCVQALATRHMVLVRRSRSALRAAAEEVHQLGRSLRGVLRAGRPRLNFDRAVRASDDAGYGDVLTYDGPPVPSVLGGLAPAASVILECRRSSRALELAGNLLPGVGMCFTIAGMMLAFRVLASAGSKELSVASFADELSLALVSTLLALGAAMTLKLLVRGYQYEDDALEYDDALLSFALDARAAQKAIDGEVSSSASAPCSVAAPTGARYDPMCRHEEVRSYV